MKNAKYLRAPSWEAAESSALARMTGKDSVTYVVFLLGVNIGKHKRVSMNDLKRMCERMGFSHVRTILASGNVIMDVPNKRRKHFASELEKMIEKTFGFTGSVIVRPMMEIIRIFNSNPFKRATVTKNTRLYVTFLMKDRREAFKHQSKLRMARAVHLSYWPQLRTLFLVLWSLAIRVQRTPWSG